MARLEDFLKQLAQGVCLLTRDIESQITLLGFELNGVSYVLKNRYAVPARIECKLIGQILSMRLTLGLICRSRSRYPMHTVKPAATAGRYNMITSGHGRALDELMLWCGTASSLSESPMQPHLRPIDYSIVSAPARRSDLKGMEIYRRPQPHETKWGSLLREMTGYCDAVHALEQEAKLADKVVEIFGDAQSASYIFANGGSQMHTAPPAKWRAKDVQVAIRPDVQAAVRPKRPQTN
jgi:hypothetical protein